MVNVILQHFVMCKQHWCRNNGSWIAPIQLIGLNRLLTALQKMTAVPFRVTMAGSIGVCLLWDFRSCFFIGYCSLEDWADLQARWVEKTGWSWVSAPVAFANQHSKQLKYLKLARKWAWWSCLITNIPGLLRVFRGAAWRSAAFLELAVLLVFGTHPDISE